MQEHSSNNFGNRLPVHSPEDALWNRIESRLDQADNEKAYYEKLQNLPQHKPDSKLWFAIERRLGMASYRRAILWTSGIAASLILSIGIINSLNNTDSANPEISQQNQNLPSQSVPSDSDLASKTSDKVTQITSLQVIKKAKNTHRTKPKADPVNNANFLAESATTNNSLNSLAENTTNTTESLQSNKDNIVVADNSGAGNTSTVFQVDEKPIVFQDLNLNPYPVEPEINSENRFFSLAMDYLPEQITANAGTALINSIGVGATYQGAKYRVHTGIGLAHNTADFTYDLSYNQTINVPVYIPGQGYDTLRYTNNSEFSNLNSSEEHQYFTYNLGGGRVLFSKGKFSLWLNAGASVALKLDKSNNHDETISKLKDLDTHGNIDDIETNLPVFNRYYFNLNTGLDFSYNIFKRLSLTVAPVTRYYITPVIQSQGETPDKYSLSFMSGLKYKL